jgi:flap endonuclease-1
MDALTFGSPRLVRHLTFSEARKMPIVEIDLAAVLHGLGLSMDEFIDLCILCGCDYTGTIKGTSALAQTASRAHVSPSPAGVGPHKAVELITKHRTIEAGLKHLDQSKFP